MVPANKATPDIIQQRVDMFECNVTGTHWPHIQNFKRNSCGAATINDVRLLQPEALQLLVGRERAAASQNSSIAAAYM
jgi:hypothetical protein